VNTLRLIIDPDDLESSHNSDALNQAAGILRAGGLVALPTETVYGLGANALDPVAVEKIFAAKQRPAWDPVIVHIDGPENEPASSAAMLNQLVTEIPDAARRLMDKFWPGPLTLLLPRTAAVPDVVTAGRPLVGIRMPAHPVALELIRRAGVPVAAPSANLFGHISPTTAAHVLADLDGRIDAVLDAGPSRHGVESTVLDPCRNPMLIYRPGAVTAEEIQEIAGPVEVFRESGELSKTPHEALPSPGVGLRHYAPRARLILVEGPQEILGKRLEIAALELHGERVGIMLPFGVDAPLGLAGCSVFFWGRWTRPEEMARELYSGLRTLDQEGCTVILCPMPPAEGIGAAIRDRLSKGARLGT
jgi:L-threonylcarbamoyladenylate synthase